MTKDEAVKTIGLYRSKIEKIEKKIRYIQAQQQYRDEVMFGYYLENIDFLIITIGLNLEALEMSIDRTLALYQDGFICQTERYIEDDTKAEVNEHTFLYLDPPYLITTATYNKAWSEQQETEMYRFLEECNARGVKWGMSNVLKNNGVNNTMLRTWIKKIQATNEDMKLYYIENDYNHANFRRKNRGATVEILLTNF